MRMLLDIILVLAQLGLLGVCVFITWVFMTKVKRINETIRFREITGDPEASEETISRLYKQRNELVIGGSLGVILIAFGSLVLFVGLLGVKI